MRTIMKLNLYLRWKYRTFLERMTRTDELASDIIMSEQILYIMLNLR